MNPVVSIFKHPPDGVVDITGIRASGGLLRKSASLTLYDT